MTRLALAVLTTIAVVAFSISNSHHVELSYAVGEPIKIRLVFLLMSTFLAGMAVPIFYGLIRRVNRREQLKREQRLQQAIQQVDHDIVG